MRECVKENSIRKMEFTIVLCRAQFASGITVGICLKSSAWGYVLTCDFYEMTSLEGSFSFTSFRPFALLSMTDICSIEFMLVWGSGQ